MDFDLAAITDPGMHRTANQDSAIAFPLGTHGALMVVADGVGGAAAGEVASSIVVETIADTVRAAEAGQIERFLMDGVVEANVRVRQAAASDARYSGMASTVVAAAITPQEEHSIVWLVHLGDSRAYVFNGGAGEQKTDDHSWVEEQIKDGLLDPAEAEAHPYRHVITRAVGISDTVEFDTMTRFFLPHSATLLLCTDGLYGPATTADLGRVVMEGEHLDTVAPALVKLANDAGGPDNIGIALYRATPPQA